MTEPRPPEPGQPPDPRPNVEDEYASEAQRHAPGEPSYVGGDHTFGTVTDKISAIVLTKHTPRAWLIGFTIAFGLLMVFLVAVSYLFMKGVGIWGLNQPVG